MRPGRYERELLPQVLPQQKSGSIAMAGNRNKLLILLVSAMGFEPMTS
jgi:hypothetical protein